MPIDKTEFLRLFEEVVEEDAGTLTGSERLREDLTGWNSLAVLSFIALADEHYGVTLSPREIAGCHTVSDLFASIEAKLARQ